MCYDKDYIQCPNCFAPDATVSYYEFRGECAYCSNCKFMWKELIEPNIVEYDKDTNPSPALEPIGFNENIFEILDEDPERYSLIMKFSNLMYDGAGVDTVTKRQNAYFKMGAIEKSKENDKNNASTLEKFIKNPEIHDLNSVFNILANEVGSPSFIFPNDSYVNVKVIGYKSWNENALAMLNINLEELAKTLSENFDIELRKFEGNQSFSEEELDTLEEIQENKENPPYLFYSDSTMNDIVERSAVIRLQETYDSTIDKGMIVDIDKKRPKIELDMKFLEKMTTYTMNIRQIMRRLEEARDLTSILRTKPLIYPMDFYLQNLETFEDVNSFLDFNNNIAFVNVDMAKLIDLLKSFNSETLKTKSFFELNDCLQVFHKGYSLEDIKFKSVSGVKENVFNVIYNRYNSDKVNEFFATLTGRQKMYSVYCESEEAIKLDGVMQKSLEMIEDLLNNTSKEALKEELDSYESQNPNGIKVDEFMDNMRIDNNNKKISDFLENTDIDTFTEDKIISFLEDNNIPKEEVDIVSILSSMQKENTTDVNSITKYDFETFLKRTTSYGITVDELHEIIRDCSPITGMTTTRPWIMDLDEYLEDVTFNATIPSLLDFDNRLVFMHISHKEVMYELCELMNLETDGSNDMIEEVYQGKINSIQNFVNSHNRDSKLPLVLTISNKEIEHYVEFLDALDKAELKYDKTHVDKTEDCSYIPLSNIEKAISGKVYFPKPEEEDIPEGRILVIPSATEEYFLSTLGNHNKKGCIITEKGSKTSHIVLMSKEFDFDIILVDNAIKKFRENDLVYIDPETKTYEIID